MKTELGERLLTVKDIARYIAFDTSEHAISKTIRQVRHWTQSDLLRPYSEKNTGKGIPRVYWDEPTVEIAAILLELSRYGATVDILKPVADALYDNADGEIELQMAMTDHANAYLQVSWQEDPESGKFVGATINIYTDEEPEEPGEPDFDAEPSSSIVVNLNKVMSRVFPLPWQALPLNAPQEDEE